MSKLIEFGTILESVGRPITMDELAQADYGTVVCLKKANTSGPYLSLNYIGYTKDTFMFFGPRSNSLIFFRREGDNLQDDAANVIEVYEYVGQDT